MGSGTFSLSLGNSSSKTFDYTRGKLSIEVLTLTPKAVALILTDNHKVWLAAILLAMALVLASCAVLQPPSPNGPKGNEPPYPILFSEDTHRKDAIAVALNQLAAAGGGPGSTEAQLAPVTATIVSISPKATGSLYLPKVGATAVMTEEETRESLRRFIREWQDLIGSDPAKLSLVERVDQPDGTKLATYEQRPFRYPIRGNFGKLQIRFSSDRRVLNLTSTCIPDVDRMQTALSALNVRLKAEDAIQPLSTNGLTYTNEKGSKLNLRIPAASQINLRGLVIYILASKDRPDKLEFHLAWEMELSNLPVKIAYIDAITGETVAVE